VREKGRKNGGWRYVRRVREGWATNDVRDWVMEALAEMFERLKSPLPAGEGGGPSFPIIYPTNEYGVKID
jgi:hypothetical protein